MDQEGATFWPAEAKVQKWSQRIDLAIRTESMTPGEVSTCCLLLHTPPISTLLHSGIQTQWRAAVGNATHIQAIGQGHDEANLPQAAPMAFQTG